MRQLLRVLCGSHSNCAQLYLGCGVACIGNNMLSAILMYLKKHSANSSITGVSVQHNWPG